MYVALTVTDDFVCYAVGLDEGLHEEGWDFSHLFSSQKINSPEKTQRGFIDIHIM